VPYNETEIFLQHADKSHLRRVVLDIYREHFFSPNAPLYQILTELSSRYGVKFIWRDMLAAGECKIKENETFFLPEYDNYPLFAAFNKIGREQYRT
jgi:hypothetical protein